MTTQLIIGVTGRLCAGKNTICDLMYEQVKQKIILENQAFKEIEAERELLQGKGMEDLLELLQGKGLEDLLELLQGKSQEDLLELLQGKGLEDSLTIQKQPLQLPEMIDLNGQLNLDLFFTSIIIQAKSQNLLSDDKKRDIVDMSEIEIEELKKIIQFCLKKQILTSKVQQKMQHALNNFKVPTIIYPIWMKSQLDFLSQRNFFHLISIDAPLHQRYKNFQLKYPYIVKDISFQFFCLIDDVLNQEDNFLGKCIEESKLLIKNSKDIKYLEETVQHQAYQEQILFRPIRPTFEEYFMYVGHLVKMRTNCMKRPVGAVVVKNNRIIATGYNGTPNGVLNCYEGGCERCNTNAHQGQNLEKCFCFHAEENAILEVGTTKSKGCTLYTTLFPCSQCTKIILAGEFEQLYYEDDYDNTARLSILSHHMVVKQICTRQWLF